MPAPLMSGDMQCAQGDMLCFTAVVTIGASGAVSTVRTTAGIAIARSSAGVYTVTLPEVYQQIIFPGAVLQQASGALIMPRVASTATVSGKTVLTFNTVVTAGTATDPANGDILRLMLVVSQSRVI